MRTNKWLSELICFILVLNFFYEGIQKLAFLSTYAFWVVHAPIIGKFGTLLKYSVPVSEISIAILLLVPSYRAIAFVAIIVMEVVFILWIMSVYMFTGYLFWPYHALWNNPTWMQKMICGLTLAWLAFVALSFTQQKKTEGKDILLRNKSANVN